MATRDEPLLLAGAARERGRIHGEAYRDLIQAHVDAWAREIGSETSLSLPAYLQRFARQTRFGPALRRWTPRLLLEVEGIAEGADIPADVCLCLQLMDQHWHHLERTKASGCSVLGGPAVDRRTTIIGQNMDLPEHVDGLQVLLRIRQPDAGAELLVPSLAGLIGLFGLSSRGFGLCVNTLSQLRTSPAGLPVAFVVRSTLQQPSLAQAAAHLRRLPHATGQNYLLGEADGLIDLECSAKGRARCRAAGSGMLCHTNHPLASDDLAPDRRGWDADRHQADLVHGLTFSRLRTLQDGADRSEALDVDQVKALLAAVAHRPAIDGPRFGVLTASSAVFELRRGRPRAHVACGPPSTPYRVVDLG